MDGAGGRKPQGGRRARSAAPRGRGAGGSPSGTATPRAPRRVGSTARRRPSAAQSLLAGPAASGGEELPAPRSKAAAARVPAARRRAALPDGAASAPGAVLRSPSVAGAPRFRKVVSRLALGREDVSEASGLVNRVVSHLTQALHGNGGSFRSINRQGSGSYYEHVKISQPNEFDIMLILVIERLQLDECDDTGAYYYLTFKRNPKERYLFKFLDEEGKISALKMLQELREVIKQEVRNIRDVEVTVQRRKAGSPAITLQIKNPPAADISVDIILTLEVKQSWPPSTRDGFKIESWLGRKVKRTYRKYPTYLVAKQNKEEKVLRGNTWRLSFSHMEKALLNDHGSSKTCCEADGLKCCRKSCLKLLKYLLEQLKMKYPKKLEKFCSYHVKTAFLHSCVIWPNDTDWQLGDLGYCFQKCLGYFLDCLQKSQLPHFFIPKYNLLSPEDKASNNFLSRQINSELNNGFPIFQERF